MTHHQNFLTLKYKLRCLDCNIESRSMEFIAGDLPDHDFYRWLPLKCTDYGAPELQNLLDFLCEHSGHRIEFIDEKGNVTKPHKVSRAYILQKSEKR